ncbi:MAG: tyrosine-type recombinase/integrase [Solirubrobacteraceae bacterium]
MSSTAGAPPAPPTLTDLRPRPVSGHLRRVKRQSGDRWRVKWRDAAGVEHKKVLGRVWSGAGRPREGYLTKQQAQRALDEILADARRVGPGARRRIGSQPIFADAALEWLRYVEFDRKRRASTLRDYRHVVESALLPMFGDVRLEQLTSEMIDAYRVHLVAEDRLSARTINKYLVLMNGILRHAQRRWGLTVNPALGVERQPVRRSGEFRVLSAKEVRALALVTALGRHHDVPKRELIPAELDARRIQDEQDAAMFITAAFAGLRLGELRALRWSDIDFELHVIHIRRAFTLQLEDVPKSGRVRATPMVDQVARALKDLARRERYTTDQDLVFPSPDGDYLEDSALRRRYYKALKAAKIEHLRFHDLRHTFGTLAVQEFALSDVKAYMGHADITTTMIYVHHIPQHDAADRLSARLAKTSGAAATLGRAAAQVD